MPPGRGLFAVSMASEGGSLAARPAGLCQPHTKISTTFKMKRCLISLLLQEMKERMRIVKKRLTCLKESPVRKGEVIGQMCESLREHKGTPLMFRLNERTRGPGKESQPDKNVRLSAEISVSRGEQAVCNLAMALAS
eukprot:1144914-Pelagomonas_calceolata.AAC.1